MTENVALIAGSIFDGYERHQNAALLLSGNLCVGLVPAAEIPAGYNSVSLDNGTLTPGFVDLQVNGGGGLLLNEQPDVVAIDTICKAHACFGTTALLPTLITTTPEVTARALNAGFEAAQKQVQGFLGLHLEGPHLDVSKKGAHCADLIRPMSDRDVTELCEARADLPNLMVTLAPESVSDDQIGELSKAGVCVSLGHTNTTSIRAEQAFSAGAVCVTHLFNAMSGLGHREPGLVGATLNSTAVFAGIIADGHHVCPDTLNIALRSKSGDGKIFLVTDAMSVIGTDLTSFTLNNRQIVRQDGKLTLLDGTLAGADLDMATAVKFMEANTFLDANEVFRMASLYPSMCLGVDRQRGSFKKGSVADIVCLNSDFSVGAVWQSGIRLD